MMAFLMDFRAALWFELDSEASGFLSVIGGCEAISCRSRGRQQSDRRV
jgi:hypothetical protein